MKKVILHNENQKEEDLQVEKPESIDISPPEPITIAKPLIFSNLPLPKKQITNAELGYYDD